MLSQGSQTADETSPAKKKMMTVETQDGGKLKTMQHQIVF